MKKLDLYLLATATSLGLWLLLNSIFGVCGWSKTKLQREAFIVGRTSLALEIFATDCNCKALVVPMRFAEIDSILEAHK